MAKQRHMQSCQRTPAERSPRFVQRAGVCLPCAHSRKRLVACHWYWHGRQVPSAIYAITELPRRSVTCQSGLPVLRSACCRGGTSAGARAGMQASVQHGQQAAAVTGGGASQRIPYPSRALCWGPRLQPHMPSCTAALQKGRAEQEFDGLH